MNIIFMDSPSYFFSQKTGSFDIIIPRQSIWDSVNKLSKLNCVHVTTRKESSLHTQPQFAQNLKQAQELLSKVKTIKEDIKRFRNVDKKEYEPYAGILQDIDALTLIRRTDGQLEINQISNQIDAVWNFMNQQKKDYEMMLAEKKNIINMIALNVSISKMSSLNFFTNNNLENQDNIQSLDTNRKTNNDVSFNFYYGLVEKAEQQRLQKLIFRVSKGNALMQTFPLQKHDLRKVIKSECIDYLDQFCLYFIMFEKGSNNTILKKIEKILSTFENYYDIKNIHLANSAQELQNLQNTLVQKCNLIQAIELNTIKRLDHLRDQKPHLKCSNIFYFEVFIRRQILIWKIVNSGQMKGSFHTLKTYIPQKDVQAVRTISRENNQQMFMISEHLNQNKFPTLYPDTEVIEIPQAIVNTYGVPNSNQLNPAPLYIVTFGFFIGVMFGDVGHSLFGVIAMFFLKPNKWWWITVFWMFYCGVMYNQFFGLNLGWGKSCFTLAGDQISGFPSCTYLFGMDPVWKVADNAMAFANSFKMKFAVIVGVIHMMIGIIIKAINGFRNRNFIDVFGVALPQIIFMCATFVYMDFLIVVKWLTNYPNPAKAPSIISTMINMALGKFDTTVYSFYPRQDFVEKILRLIIIVVVPYLLIAKPFVLWIKKLVQSNQTSNSLVIKPKHKNIEMKELIPSQQIETQQNYDGLAADLTSIVSEQSLTESDDNHHSMQDIMVHQLIETIQFVLGSVSNTASYLRLWALSLAHVQLSEVFFEMLLESYFEKSTYLTTIPLFFLFIAFILVSFGILFCMDTMECFLHSLRLHWVEFQNKFFAGDGFLFVPINFSKEIQSQIQS